jgi:nitrite reductase (NO-forming)/hydroxylamine reductase
MGTLIHGGFTQREYKKVVQSTKEISNFLIALKEAGQVWRIDYSDPSFPITKVTNVGHILHDGFLSADNKFFYVASQVDDWMAVIDVSTMEVVERIATGDTPHPCSGAIWTARGTWY